MPGYRDEINSEDLHDLLDYNPETGVLTWKPRTPRIHARYCAAGVCGSGRSSLSVWNSTFAGQAAGSVHKSPGKPDYLRIRLAGWRIMSHNVIWCMMTGCWPVPPLTVDHKDRYGSNNRWKNLRIATLSQQRRNRRDLCEQV